MKQETLDKIASLVEAVPDARPLMDKFKLQAEATRQLFAKCDIHPGLHSFLDMDLLRQQIHEEIQGTTTVVGPLNYPTKLALYAPGGSEDILMDSIFDEAIDDIVESFSKECVQGKPTTRLILGRGYKEIPFSRD